MRTACLVLSLALSASAQPLRAQEAPRFSKNAPTKIGDTVYCPYLFEGHVHSQHSPDARHPVVTILQTAEQLGMDALILTDHGSIEARRDFADYHGSVVPIIGAEIGGQFGHAVYWNVDADDPHVPSVTSLATRCKFAHDHGGLLVFAHPGWWIHGNPRNPMEWMTPSALRRDGGAGMVDAIELWNGVYDGPLPKLIDAWVKLLRAGVYVPIVGNSDFHQFRFHRIGDAHDIALCDQPDVKTCLDLRSRRERLRPEPSDRRLRRRLRRVLLLRHDTVRTRAERREPCR